tara:strand:- start:80 stop:529 length:450 start_codon:yes stop_codon:yes gene_type:complete
MALITSMSNVMRLIKGYLFILFFPGLCFADAQLNFKVTNHSKLQVNFRESSSWFGKWVYPNKTVQTTVKKTPSLIEFHLTTYQTTAVSIDRSCEVIGIPPFYKSFPIYRDDSLYGVPVLYQAGTVHVTIEEAADSSTLFNHIICKVEKS